MRKYSKEEQEKIIKILSKKFNKPVEYNVIDPSDQKFITTSKKGWFWHSISEKIVEEAIKEAGILILKEEKKDNRLFCNNCNIEISLDSKFCKFCGQKVILDKEKQNHIFIEDNESRFWICNYCNEKLKTKFELDEHKETCELNPKKENKLLIKDIEEKNMETAPQKNNKSAVIGFVLSLISIFGVGLAGIIGMILGIVALTKIKYTNEKGKGLAIAAIIIGFIWGIGVGILRQLVNAGF